MSNLQDVPLAEPENLPSIEQIVTGTKSNSLKRFFKLGKKSNSTQDINTDASCEVLEDEVSKDSGKPGSISRFLTRFKGTSKSGKYAKTYDNRHMTDNNLDDMPSAADQPTDPTTSSPGVMVEAPQKPQPNAKPTLKTSISSYWKVLFHRQKAANRHGADSEQEPMETQQEQEKEQQQMDMNEMQQVQQEQQTDPIKAEDAFTVTPATSNQDLKTPTLMSAPKLVEFQTAECIPQILEEVQVLTISDEIVEPSSLDEPKLHN